jgi:choline-sulfatase
MRTALLCCLSSFLIVSCSPASRSEPAAIASSQPPAPLAQASTGSSPTRGEPPPAQIAAASPARVRTYYDLATHVERGELRRGDALLIDFGDAGDAKYTYGGWLTGSGRAATIEGASARLVPEEIVKLALPYEHEGAAELTLRLRGFYKGPLTVHMNDQVIADRPLNGERLETLTLALPAEVMKRGENLLQLRVTRAGSGAGVPKAGLALDWLSLAPAGAAAPGAAPATQTTAARSTAKAQAKLTVPAGHALGFAIEIPEHAELQAIAQSAAEGSVWAIRDGVPPLQLAATRKLEPGARVRVDLGPIAGDLARIELRAGEAELAFSEARIVTRAEEPKAQPPQARNAIIILIDTLRADKLSPYRKETRVRTPGLQTFLSGAAVMQNARTQENWTKPSVATLLSSLLPWQHNAVTGDAVVPDAVELMPELLGKRGFYTGAFIANGYVSDKFGFKQGWSSYRNYIREGRRNTAQYVAADVLDWLDTRPKDKPFFLYMHTIDPHVPYKPPSHFLSMYDTEPYSGPIDFTGTSELLEKIKIGSMRVSTRDKVRLEALYDAEISYHDVHFAALMEGLKQRGLYDDTMVVITADHGEEFWDHGSVGHGHSVYDELLHIPLIVRVPGLTEAQQRVPDAVGLVDVMPTVLDAMGQEIPGHLMGHSFLPELRGEAQSAPRTAVSGFMRGWRTVGIGRYKLIQRTLDHAWVYDVKSDPHETQDLAQARPIARGYLRGLLGLALAAQPEERDERVRKLREHTQEKTTIDKKTEAQLKALGYVGSSAK